MRLTKAIDLCVVKNDPYLEMFLQASLSKDRTQYVCQNQVLEDIKVIIPTMTPERGRAINPKMYPLPEKWQFCQILSRVDHNDPAEFENRIADVLFWTLPFAGNPVCCIPLKRTEDYMLQTKEETGQYTLDLFSDDAVADVLSQHKFWEKPVDSNMTTLAAAQIAFDVLRDLNKNGLACFSSESKYIQKFLYGFSPSDVRKIVPMVERILITSGLMDNTNRKTDNEGSRLSLSCLGESFINIIDSVNPGKISYLYFDSYDKTFRYALCKRIAKQIVSDGYDFFMSLEKIERSEKRSFAKSAKSKEPQNIWEITEPEETKTKSADITEDEAINRIAEEEVINRMAEQLREEEDERILDETSRFLKGEKSSINEIKAYPKALSEKEIEEMHRPVSSSAETEENKSYTSNLVPRPPFDPLALARNDTKVDEERVLALSQHIMEFIMKEKAGLPQSVKTALKEALTSLMEL